MESTSFTKTEKAIWKTKVLFGKGFVKQELDVEISKASSATKGPKISMTSFEFDYKTKAAIRSAGRLSLAVLTIKNRGDSACLLEIKNDEYCGLKFSPSTAVIVPGQSMELKLVALSAVDIIKSKSFVAILQFREIIRMSAMAFNLADGNTQRKHLGLGQVFKVEIERQAEPEDSKSLKIEAFEQIGARLRKSMDEVKISTLNALKRVKGTFSEKVTMMRVELAHWILPDLSDSYEDEEELN